MELDITYPAAWGSEGIEARVAALCARAVDAVQSGYNILIVSDRLVDADRVAIPALLATSAVHQHLIRAGLRTNAGLVVETGSAREVHHFALLGGYGAEAIHPYLALESLGHLADPDKAIKNYTKAIGKGLNKVMSKMGISTYMSYCGAQIFEAVGLQRALVDKYFTGTASNIEGIGIFQVAEEALRMHRAAFGKRPGAGQRPGRRRRIRLASAAKNTCGRPTPSLSCSTRRARTTTAPTRNTRRSSTTRAAAT